MNPFCQWDVEMGWIIFCTAGKVSKCGVFSGPSFPVFGLNTEIYGVNLRMQSEYRKRRTRKEISVFSPNTVKYGPEKTPYLDTFHAVLISSCYCSGVTYGILKKRLKNYNTSCLQNEDPRFQMHFAAFRNYSYTC